MNGFALDTNIVSAHLRGDSGVGAQIKANAQLYLPVTVLGELYYGAHHTEHREQQLRRIRSFLPLVQTMHLDDEIAEQYGKVKGAASGTRLHDTRKRHLDCSHLPGA